MHETLVNLGLHLVLVGNLLVFLGVPHLPFALLGIVNLATFAGFCYAARLFTTSIVSIPFIALQLQIKLVSVIISYAARGFKPAFPEWTFIFEITISMMRYVFERFSEAIVNENTALVRAPIKRYGEKILDSTCRQYGTIPEKLFVNEMEHLWLRDPHKKQLHIVVLHFHGGGYCMSDPLMNLELGNQTHAMLKQIFKDKHQLEVSVDVLLVRYRMAPERVYPTALNDCFAMYKHVLKHENVLPTHVVLSGDSAGAEMSISTCMRLREGNSQLQPGVVLCYSPVVDFSDVKSGESAPYCLLVDTFLQQCIPLYLRNVKDLNDVSPINHSLQDLPPFFLQWGSLERFYEQGLRFKAKAEAEGVTKMEFDFLPNMVHDVVMFPWEVCPSAEKGLRNGCEFAAKNLAPVLRGASPCNVNLVLEFPTKATPFA
ncbi:Esterase [Phytophthora citrophthora]|uniref:Esterase n=1 Tax=Phytophthora citrophthora TaxID=4793 RepID=A0AAD9G6A3_9STRA|nr:Esterase [Phytophthora citrophthora]